MGALQVRRITVSVEYINGDEECHKTSFTRCTADKMSQKVPESPPFYEPTCTVTSDSILGKSANQCLLTFLNPKPSELLGC